jgi:hypothetical protein
VYNRVFISEEERSWQQLRFCEIWFLGLASSNRARDYENAHGAHDDLHELVLVPGSKLLVYWKRTKRMVMMAVMGMMIIQNWYH